jgi:hypothetical protein
MANPITDFLNANPEPAAPNRKALGVEGSQASSAVGKGAINARSQQHIPAKAKPDAKATPPCETQAQKHQKANLSRACVRKNLNEAGYGG